MTHRAVFALLASSMLALGSGCCCLPQLTCCKSEPGPSSGPWKSAAYEPAPYAMDGCSDSCGDSCDAHGCGNGGCDPLAMLVACFGSWGCGDSHWCDWKNEPPDNCDPCDRHGNWVGGGSPHGPGVEMGPYVGGETETIIMPEPVTAQKKNWTTRRPVRRPVQRR